MQLALSSASKYLLKLLITLALVSGSPVFSQGEHNPNGDQNSPTTEYSVDQSSAAIDSEEIEDFVLELENFEEQKLAMDITPGQRKFIGALRGVLLTLFLGAGTYIDYYGSSVDFSKVLTNFDNFKVMFMAMTAGAVAGAESGALSIWYKKFQKFLADPQIFYRLVESMLIRMKQNPEKKIYRPILFLAKELNSFFRGGYTEIIYMIPVFATLAAFGFEEYKGILPFLDTVIWSSALVLVAQTSTEVALANMTMLAKKYAETLQDAQTRQFIGTTIGAIVSVTATTFGVLHGLGSSIGTIGGYTLTTMGGLWYLAYFIKKIINVYQGTDTITISTIDNSSYWHKLSSGWKSFFKNPLGFMKKSNSSAASCQEAFNDL